MVVNLGQAQRIPQGEGRQFQVGPEVIAVFRTRDGGVFATQAACSHKSGPLADGLVSGRKVVCPLHAYAFSLHSGRADGHACEWLRTYRTSLNPDGDILVDVSSV